ncbi:hypothetical protein [Streptomyces mirabilis]|uniref:hypothetical protein n=1 Tax=Streptomyces mirabilis TaxID=68239 RepID=UPI00367A8A88
MGWSDLVDPVRLIGEIQKAFSAYQGTRIVALGDTGVGKTTFWHYAQHNSPAPVDLSRTAHVEQLGKFIARDLDVMFVKQRVKAVDVPGHLWGTWEEAVREANPHGILFLCDHAEGFDKRDISEDRLEAHKRAFLRVAEVIESAQPKALKRLAVVVNKRDLWKGATSRVELLHKSGIGSALGSLSAGGKIAVTATDCSALYGENVKTTLAFLAGN